MNPVAAPINPLMSATQVRLSHRLLGIAAIAGVVGCGGPDTIDPIDPPVDGSTVDLTSREKFDRCFPPDESLMFKLDVRGISYPGAEPVDGSSVLAVDRENLAFEGESANFTAGLLWTGVPSEVDASNVLRVQTRAEGRKLGAIWFGTPGMTWGDVWAETDPSLVDSQFAWYLAAVFGEDCSFNDLMFTGPVLAYTGSSARADKDFGNEYLDPTAETEVGSIRSGETKAADVSGTTHTEEVEVTLIAEPLQDGGNDEVDAGIETDGGIPPLEPPPDAAPADAAL